MVDAKEIEPGVKVALKSGHIYEVESGPNKHGFYQTKRAKYKPPRSFTLEQVEKVVPPYRSQEEAEATANYYEQLYNDSEDDEGDEEGAPNEPLSSSPPPLPKTVAPGNSKKFEHIQTWEDGVAQGITFREKLDQTKFDLGDLVNFMCPSRKSGRPKDDEKARYTLTAFAGDIREDRSTLSQLASNAEFWPEDWRSELPPQLSWRQLARARVDSGWRRGMKPTEEHRQKAFDVLIEMTEGEYEKPKTERKLEAGDYARRIIKACEKASKECELEGEVKELFVTIHDSAWDVIGILGDDD